MGITSQKVFSLNGTWLLASTGQKAKAPRTWPLTARVPGNVHLDLVRQKKIPDPYYGENFLKCAWIEKRDWWYEKRFRVPTRFRDFTSIRLIFDGIDTAATVWLNNIRLGSTANMFVPAVFNVTGLVDLKGVNTLTVRIHSAIRTVRAGAYQDRVRQYLHGNERLFIRKAQYNFGWDIAPRLLSVGIWRGVSLEGTRAVGIDDIFVSTRSIGSAARLTADITFTNHTAGKKNVDLEAFITGPDRKVFFTARTRKAAGPGTGHWSFPFTVVSPALWWPRGYGPASRYCLKVKVSDQGRTLDTGTKKFGIRTVGLVQKKQADGGTSFYFTVNGKKIFIKGTNWVPLDAMPAKVTAQKYRAVMRLVTRQNLNCIRIWGGGYYEDDYVYELCDRQGILVWQDFMFACARYPEDQPFLDQVRAEAEYIVRHLRSRPSLLVWGGDNEVDASHTWGFRKREFKDNKINRQVLPQVCRRLCPLVPYIPSSPFSPRHRDPNAAREGDVHLWYHGTYYDDPVYTGSPWRFVSEIGHLAVPAVSSLRKFLPVHKLWPPFNRTWDLHFGSVFSLNAHPKRREKLDQAIRHMLGYVPDTLEGYVRASQEVQARALTCWIDHARKSRVSGGIIYWNLIDCWPQCSDAVVDYFLKPKSAYHAVRRAFRDRP